MNLPLDGRRILVTRRGEQAIALVDSLATLGASVVEVPAIEVVPPADSKSLDSALAGHDEYDWVLFTSANAVRSVKERLTILRLRGFPGRARVAVVGPATGGSYRELFPEGELPLQPAADFRAEGLLAALAAEGVSGRVLLPTSDRARDVLPRGLRSLGATVDVFVAYCTVNPPGLAEALWRELGRVDIVTFASASAVEGFARAVGETAGRFPAAVLGPVTETAAREAGLDVRVVASPSTVNGLVQGILRYFAVLSSYSKPSKRGPEED